MYRSVHAACTGQYTQRDPGGTCVVFCYLYYGNGNKGSVVSLRYAHLVVFHILVKGSFEILSDDFYGSSEILSDSTEM